MISQRQPRRHWKSPDLGNLVRELEEMQKRVVSLDSSLSLDDLQRMQLEQMQRLREFEKSQVLACWARGIRELPDEILSDIFTFAVDEPLSSTRIALHLVSRRWNEVARATPAINRFIWLERDAPSRDATALLAKAKNCHGLELTLNYPGCTVEELEETMKQVHHSVPRWRALNIDSTASFEAMQAALKYLVTPAPGLERLELTCAHHVREGFWPDDLEVSEDIFSGETPHLRNIILRGVPLLWGSGVFNGLEALTLEMLYYDDRPSFDDLKLISENSPDLRFLYLRSSGPSGPVSDEPITFAKLEVLQVEGVTEDLLHFLPYISTPALTKLKIECNDEWWATSLASFIGAGPFVLPSLRWLGISGDFRSKWAPPAPQDDISMLRRLPSLQHLSIQNPSRELIQALATEGDSGWICPQLEALEIHNALYVLPRDVEQMIEGRSVSGKRHGDGALPLRSLEILWCTHFHEDSKFVKWAREKLEVVHIKHC